MNRCWFGGGLLALLLIISLLLSSYIAKAQFRLGDSMLRAAELTDSDREKAQETTDQVRKQWEACRFLTAVLTDHAPMEEIEENFQLLTPRADTEDFREVCLRLAARLKALGKSQLPTLENLF